MNPASRLVPKSTRLTPLTGLCAQGLDQLLESFIFVKRKVTAMADGSVKYDTDKVSELVARGTSLVLDHAKFCKIGNGMLRSVEPKKAKKAKITEGDVLE